MSALAISPTQGVFSSFVDHIPQLLLPKPWPYVPASLLAFIALCHDLQFA